jgi:hypothetical protein
MSGQAAEGQKDKQREEEDVPSTGDENNSGKHEAPEHETRPIALPRPAAKNHGVTPGAALVLIVHEPRRPPERDAIEPRTSIAGSPRSGRQRRRSLLLAPATWVAVCFSSSLEAVVIPRRIATTAAPPERAPR